MKTLIAVALRRRVVRRTAGFIFLIQFDFDWVLGFAVFF